jgi:hypothetical protein
LNESTALPEAAGPFCCALSFRAAENSLQNAAQRRAA